MTQPAPIYPAFDDWITHEAIDFSVDSPGTFNAAVARLLASIGEPVELLGFGEANTAEEGRPWRFEQRLTGSYKSLANLRFALPGLSPVH